MDKKEKSTFNPVADILDGAVKSLIHNNSEEDEEDEEDEE